MTECNAIIEANNEIDELKRENKKLNESCVRYGFEVGRLEEENEELKQRNDRQAKQLDRLYGLIEEKNWTAFSDIIDDFKRCEEQLQKELNMWRNKVHVRLNELYDENQKLKEANQDLQYKIGEVTNLLHKEIKTSKNAFYGLMQENKELRQKIAQLKNK